MIKVEAIYFQEKPNRKKNPWASGLIIRLEDGRFFRQNCCENQCLVAFTETNSRELALDKEAGNE